SPLVLIGTAWNFYKKQPVLNEIAFWMFFLPVAFMDAFSGMIGVAEAQGTDTADLTSYTAMEIAIVIPLLVALFFFLFWGQACVLTVAKRLVSSPAGRNRTSFKAVRKEAYKFIGPLALLEILRGITTLLWAILLIVPGVIYSIRTVFYDIMMIEEGKVAYGRPVLHKSIDFVKGRTKDVFLTILALSLCIFIPVAIIDSIIVVILTLIDSRLETLAAVLTDFIDSFAGVFFMVCMVAYYADLKKNSNLKSSK
ncbi:MAG: hypothetical protein QF815_01465, partial [Candidatus Peribacteraceae bacterium]|nr:hypothetical protein [Candidatus Peribacteraceae bacterium]